MVIDSKQLTSTEKSALIKYMLEMSELMAEGYEINILDCDSVKETIVIKRQVEEN